MATLIRLPFVSQQDPFAPPATTADCAQRRSGHCNWTDHGVRARNGACTSSECAPDPPMESGMQVPRLAGLMRRAFATAMAGRDHGRLSSTGIESSAHRRCVLAIRGNGDSSQSFLDEQRHVSSSTFGPTTTPSAGTGLRACVGQDCGEKPMKKKADRGRCRPEDEEYEDLSQYL